MSLNPNLIYIIILFISTHFTTNAQTFDQNYVSSWGGDHVNVLDQGREVQIKIDQSSGGGFKSKQAYTSGLFKLDIKIPQHASGIVTTFYLTSEPDNGPGGAHTELDFEILGQNGPPYRLHTNVFAQDNGGREQQIKLWFDPTSGFHEYKIIWNQQQIVFFVDGTPVRVVKDYTKIGAKYPTLPMHVRATLWNASKWLGPTDWSNAPFYANFRGFTIQTSPKFQRLNAPQQTLYQNIKKTSILYDYCKQTNAHNFPECTMNM